MSKNTFTKVKETCDKIFVREIEKELQIKILSPRPK